ncbi:hypothetical protein BDN72DRAFT_842759 [Pluteus cervinus]|uniref:Uncharacterized protein n=1 Tax=Pluteus cervinus TaxID=181527 RepID=A0ACD3APT7_9AGAR|nr:hypothetical protein BDN72DRAFT_842759 [Pluteus cervinus]
MTPLVTLTSFARETIEEILSHIDLRIDLINFACTSRIAASHVIPRHLEYRVLKIGSTAPTLWAHLAFRPDLALNVRAVAFTSRTNPGDLALERVPTSFASEPGSRFRMPQMSIQDLQIYREKQLSNMIQAFRSMKNLKIFMIKCQDDLDTPGLLSEQHTLDLLLAILGNKPNLKQLGLCHHFDREDNLCDVGKLASVDLNLSCLSLAFSVWHYHHSERALINVHSWVLRSNLVFLNLSRIEVDDSFGHLVIPSLKSFVIFVGADIQPIICAFLEKNPSIEGLNWSPQADALELAPGVLPNLKRLRGTAGLLNAFEAAYLAAQTPVKYKIEVLTIWFLKLENLLNVHCLDRTSLRQIAAGEQMKDMFEVLHRIANNFPSIEVLRLQGWAFQELPLEQWYDLLPQFTNLQAVPCMPISNGIDDQDTEVVKEVVMRLGRSCPKLKTLPGFPPTRRRKDLRTELTRRVVNGEEHIEYKVREVPSPKTFDVYGDIWVAD